jgi:tetratricopeptide (TPR) repeat protein
LNSNSPVGIEGINGDVIGTSVSGIGNFVGKDIHYTVRGNIFQINNPSIDSIEELKKILKLPSESSIDIDSGFKNNSTLRDLRTIEKHIEEILDLLNETDTKIGTTTKKVKAGEIQISRIDLLLKRAIVLIEQANRYWNVVSRNTDINMYKTKLKEAQRILEEASKLDEYNTEVLLYIAKIQGKLTPLNSIKMRNTLRRIQNLLEIPHNDAERFQLAQVTFLLAISDKQVDDESLQDAREMFRDLGRRDLVRQCDDLLHCAEGQIESAKAFFQKGLVLYSMNRYQQAIECFDKAILIDANNPRIWISKGSILGNLGRYQQAIECFDKAILIDANNPEVLKSKGTANHYLGNYQQAIEYFNRALELDPNDSGTWNGKGISLDYFSKYYEAIECFDKAIGLNPKNDYTWYDKAVAFDYLKKYEEAIVCYDKSIDINPDNAVAWYGKGTSLRKLRKYEEAIVCYDKSIDINPDNAFVWFGRGLALHNLGNHEQGSKSIDKAKLISLSLKAEEF